jgi:hypothetical protein|tara:strand:- start:233 stop:424 length:192 start_codon:yes stop_codon:yes gene_type:complete
MKYNWNEDTINHFRFESMYENTEKIEKRIKEFVEIDCTIEDGESEEDLVDDLMNQVYKPLNLV